MTEKKLKPAQNKALRDIESQMAFYKSGFLDGYNSCHQEEKKYGYIDWRHLKKRCFQAFNKRFLIDLHDKSRAVAKGESNDKNNNNTRKQERSD
jgi:hypothetical protein